MRGHFSGSVRSSSAIVTEMSGGTPKTTHPRGAPAPAIPSEAARGAGGARLGDRERDEQLADPRLEDAGEQERPRGGCVHATRRCFRGGGHERYRERADDRRDSCERRVRPAVQAEPKPDAHPAEQHGGDQRESDGHVASLAEWTRPSSPKTPPNGSSATSGSTRSRTP